MTTHYDANDDHAPLGDTLEPDQLNEIVDHLERSNILMIKGGYYYLDHWGEPREDGSIAAILTPLTESAPF